jgi:hypothetical protein
MSGVLKLVLLVLRMLEGSVMIRSILISHDVYFSRLLQI